MVVPQTELRVSCKGLTSSVSKRRMYRYSYNVHIQKEKETERRDSLPIKSDL